MLTQQELQTVKQILDPFFFMYDILGIEILTDEQKRIVRSVWENDFTGVKSAHSIGKTFLAACIVLSFVIPNENSIVVTTAPTGRQVKDLLWKEIRQRYSKAKYNLGGDMLTTDYNISDKWYATGITTEPGKEEESAIKFQGYHAPKILIVIDEAPGVHKTIWEAIDGIASSEGAKILAIGNPITVNCAFKKHLEEPNWKELKISAFSHPNVKQKKEVIPGAVSYKWVVDKIRKWCDVTDKHDKSLHTFEFEGKIYIPNDLFLWKVLGEFPLEDTDSLIALHRIQEAMERESKIGENICDLGIDVARFGTEYSMFYLNKNNYYSCKPFYHFSTTKLTAEAIQYIIEHKPNRIAVDCDGIGAGVYDNLEEYIKEKRLDITIFEIHGNASPIELEQTEEFINLRSQMYWLLRNDIDSIAIEKNEDVEEGLSSIKYTFNSKGKIQIEPKDNFKKRMKRSSDYEDGLVYCNACKYLTKPSYIIGEWT